MNPFLKDLRDFDPIRELDDFRKRLSKVFVGSDEFAPDTETHLAKPEWSPAVDISEDANEYLVKADLPSVHKEDVKVTVERGVLTIAGERKREMSDMENERKFHRIERSHGRYLRSFRLPENVDDVKVRAAFHDGVLSVHLPKSAEDQPRQVHIPVE